MNSSRISRRFKLSVTDTLDCFRAPRLVGMSQSHAEVLKPWRMVWSDNVSKRRQAINHFTSAKIALCYATKRAWKTHDPWLSWNYYEIPKRSLELQSWLQRGRIDRPVKLRIYQSALVIFFKPKLTSAWLQTNSANFGLCFTASIAWERPRGVIGHPTESTDMSTILGWDRGYTGSDINSCSVACVADCEAKLQIRKITHKDHVTIQLLFSFTLDLELNSVGVYMVCQPNTFLWRANFTKQRFIPTLPMTPYHLL